MNAQSHCRHMVACPSCGCVETAETEVEEIVCAGCGRVLEASALISTVQFESSAAGGSAVVGSQRIFEQDSKSTRDGKSFITQLCIALHLDTDAQAIPVAVGLFRRAAGKKFLRGRKVPEVAASCVCIMCRQLSNGRLIRDVAAHMVCSSVLLRTLNSCEL